MVKATLHFMPASFTLGYRWHSARRNLYLSFAFWVLRIHFWSPPEAKYRFGIYQVSEDGCVYHTVRAISDEDAIEKTQQYLLNVAGMAKDEIGEMWVEKRYEKNDNITFQMDDCNPISLTANEWSEVYAGDRCQYLGCSEW